MMKIHGRIAASTGRLLTLLILVAPSTSWAGVEACGGLRIEEAAHCQLRGSVDCEAGCDELGVYKKACATQLHTVCKEECVLDPEPTCTDSCTETCTTQCDLGKNIICIHNCFGECSGTCESDCDDASDPAQCEATCEANCDGECDIKCKPLVEGDCYTHCVECCGGSCTAQVNMDCQQSCQEEEFETCEYEFKVDCEASCDVEGALFCDGEFALAGQDVPTCVSALAAKGLGNIDLDLEADAEARANLDAGCSFSKPGQATRPWGLGFLLFAGLAFTRRRRERRGVRR